MVSFARDFRLAARALSRKPGITVLVVASLALAIGFSTASFSVLDAYSLRNLPVREPERLDWIYVTTRENRPDILNWAEYRALATRSRLFSAIVAQDREGPLVKLPDRDDFPITANVSDNYFDALGVKAAVGDVFHDGKGGEGVVVLSDRYWRQALGSDANVVGRSLHVGRGSLTVIGVLPPGFSGALRGIAVDLFVPTQTWFGALRAASPDDARYTQYEAIGRRRPGITLEQARAALEDILRQVEKNGLSAAPDRKATLEQFTYKGLIVKLQENAILLAAMVLLILIAAANLANLRLVDNEGRRRETAIRLAMGAGRWDLARRHLAETVLLGAMGTAAGVLLAAWLIRAAASLLYAGKRYVDFGIRLDARTFAFSAGALLAVALIGALIPLGDAWRRRITAGLQGSRVTGSSRWLTALVVTQMALVTGVTCSAGLVWRSLENVSAIRPAMDPDRRLLMASGFWQGGGQASAPPAETLPNAGIPGQRLAFRQGNDAALRAETLAGNIAALPGVAKVAWARRALLSGSGGGASITVELPRQPKLSFRYNQVSADYFAATGARVLSGRPFRESDTPGSTPVAMVNSEFVRRFFDGRDPLGAWVKVGGKDRQIVGVVENGPTIHLRELIEPYFYFPFAQMPVDALTFFVDSRQDPGRLADTVRASVRDADKAFTLVDMMTMRQHMRGARSAELLAAEVTGGLAAIGLLLAAAGLFGVSLYAVARRTPEFGLRVAMGATPSRLARQVLREAAIRIALALPLGWALAYAGRHAMEKLVYGIAPDDPRTFALASLVVAAAGCVAALEPALRAARVDPMAALRCE